ncbi:FAD-dependent monooxygenase, partial [Streptomyces daliensis]|nr:FAD-dependent monooxygenase [Streptomyces daliensis]
HRTAPRPPLRGDCPGPLRREPQEWFDVIDFSDSAAAAARIAQEFDGWAPELTALITDADLPPLPRPIFALPLGHTWDRVPGVTLLGDAAHLLAPNGEGANSAMYDGAELGKAIAAHPDDIEAVLGQYEEAMFPRSVEFGSIGAELHELDGEDVAEGLIDMYTDSGN